jgi:hypothetical protein
MSIDETGRYQKWPKVNCGTGLHVVSRRANPGNPTIGVRCHHAIRDMQQLAARQSAEKTCP